MLPQQRQLFLTLFLALVGLAGASCARSSTPTASPEPTCYLQPQATGEKYIPVVLGTPPPPQAGPGETISLSFSGGYLVGNNARVCGSKGIVGYVFSDQLPGYSYQRTIRVQLDEEVLAELGCDYDCPVEVTIPATAGQGPRRLRLLVPWADPKLDFELIVVARPSPAAPSSTPRTPPAPLH